MKKWKDFFAVYDRQKFMKLILSLVVLVTVLLLGGFYLCESTPLPWRSLDIQAATGGYLSGVDRVSEDHTGYITISGWAFKEGESIETVNVKVLLQDTLTGKFYQLGTSYVERSDVQAMMNTDEYDYTSCGYCASVRKSALKGDRTYHIFLQYCNNGENTLIDTTKEFNKNRLEDAA